MLISNSICKLIEGSWIKIMICLSCYLKLKQRQCFDARIFEENSNAENVFLSIKSELNSLYICICVYVCVCTFQVGLTHMIV